MSYRVEEEELQCICISRAWLLMAGAEEIQVWGEWAEVLDVKMSFGSSFIKGKKKKKYIYIYMFIVSLWYITKQVTFQWFFDVQLTSLCVRAYILYEIVSFFHCLMVLFCASYLLLSNIFFARVLLFVQMFFSVNIC